MAKKRKLAIYLFKQEVKFDSDCLKNLEECAKHDVRVGTLKIGNLYVKSTLMHPPPWLDFFDKTSAEGRIKLKVAHASAVLLVESSGRRFAVTFGHGWTLVDNSKIEDRFGLKVTLNSIPVDSLRSIDTRSLDQTQIVSRDQSSVEAEIGEFGLDVERYLLRGVTATPSDVSLGTRLSGADSLIPLVEVNVKTLKQLLKAYLERFSAKTYKKHFSWVDHIAEVRNPAIKANLNKILLKSINNSKFTRLWLAIPQVIEWERVRGFRINNAETGRIYSDLHFDNFIYESENVVTYDLRHLKNTKVFAISGENDLPVYTWPLYKCIHFEVKLTDNVYILSDGQWYVVNGPYSKSLESEVSKLIDSHSILPPAKDGEHEDKYNERVSKADAKKYALMDQKLIYLDSAREKIEFCDLYTKSREIIHVKRYGNSSVLSHLVAQGLVSGELFYLHDDFRKKVNDKLPESHKLGDFASKPDPAKYDIVYAVISNEVGSLSLPFFTKVNLRSAAQRLAGYGYKVKVVKVDIVP